jgi:rod shape-determining protein MreC
VITPDGIVGKVKEVFPQSSQVLLINDHDSGAGVILESSRLQGIVKGTSLGELQIVDIMSDEKVEPGEHVVTSGGDRIYPKGYAVGTVISSTPDRDNDPFLAIKIKPAANLNRLEEVLIITKMTEDTQPLAGPAPMRAADILSQRLPSVPKQDPNAPKVPGGTTTGAPAATASPSPTPVKATKPAEAATEQKPGIAGLNPPLSGTAAAKPTPNPLKPPPVGTGATVPATGSPNRPATGTATATPGSAPNKSGAETKKPPSTGAGLPTPAGAGGAMPGVTAAPPKPKPTPKATPKKSPTATTDSNTGASGSKAPDQSRTNAPAATPSATPSPTPEKPPR